STRPTTSNLNYVPATARANLVVARLDSDGRACVFTRAETHIVADIQGYLTAELAAPVVTLPPTEVSVPVQQPSQSAGGFVHPGVFVDQAKLDEIRANVAAGRRPWLDAYNQVRNNGYARLTYTPHPVPV